jgi:hypothetical protein
MLVNVTKGWAASLKVGSLMSPKRSVYAFGNSPKYVLFVRQIIEAEGEKERQGRVQPVILSDHEKDVIIKWGKQRAEKQKEIKYWLKLSLIMAEGLTREQAREKIYQDLLNKGDIEGAQRLRQYQDVVHPLKTDNPQTPATPDSATSL